MFELNNNFYFDITVRKYEKLIQLWNETTLKCKVQKIVEATIDSRLRIKYTPFLRKEGKTRLSECKLMSAIPAALREEKQEKLKISF